MDEMYERNGSVGMVEIGVWGWDFDGALGSFYRSEVVF